MEAVVDLDAADGTSATTFKAPGAGWVDVNGIFGRFEEAVASAGFSTTAGVASVTIGSTEVATWSTGVGAVAKSIGDTAEFTPASEALKRVKVAAGDAIIMKTKTQGVGGTVTGTVRAYVPIDVDLG
jgi:uncharacterized cupin superfamily protein